MIGRQDLRPAPCQSCGGIGKSAKNRKKDCPDCKGTGTAWICKNCGGVYGKECVDTCLDQSYCEKEKP